MPGDLRRHLRVERRHDLRELLEDRDREPATHEVLGHLEADEPTAYHDRLAAGRLVEPRANAARIGNGPHHEHTRQVETRCVGAHRRRAGREHQGVVGLVPLVVRAKVLHADRLRGAIDGEHLVLGAYVDVEPITEHLARRDEEHALVGDDIADMVGKPAVGERHVRAPIEEDDLGRLVESPQSRGRRRPAGNAAHDQNPLRHARLPSLAAVSRCRGAAAGRFRRA